MAYSSWSSGKPRRSRAVGRWRLELIEPSTWTAKPAAARRPGSLRNLGSRSQESITRSFRVAIAGETRSIRRSRAQSRRAPRLAEAPGTPRQPPLAVKPEQGELGEDQIERPGGSNCIASPQTGPLLPARPAVGASSGSVQRHDQARDPPHQFPGDRPRTARSKPVAAQRFALGALRRPEPGRAKRQGGKIGREELHGGNCKCKLKIAGIELGVGCSPMAQLARRTLAPLQGSPFANPNPKSQSQSLSPYQPPPALPNRRHRHRHASTAASAAAAGRLGDGLEELAGQTVALSREAAAGAFDGQRRPGKATQQATHRILGPAGKRGRDVANVVWPGLGCEGPLLGAADVQEPPPRVQTGR